MLIDRGAYKKKATVSLSLEREAKRDEVCQHLQDGTYPREEVPCFCGNPGGVIVAERDRYGLPVTTLLCMDCGLMRSSPRMTQEATTAFYENDYRKLYTSRGRSADTLFAQQHRFGKDLVDLTSDILKSNGLIYEVGSGCGGLLAAYKEAGYRVAGCDLGSQFLNTGKAHGIELVNGSVEDLVSYMGEKADLLCMVNVIEHFLELSDDLLKAIDAVKPGGYLFIKVPGISSIEDIYKGNVLRYLQNAHTYHFTKATLTYVLETCGLQVIVANEGIDAFAQRPLPNKNIQVRSTIGTNEAQCIVDYLVTLEGIYGQSAKGVG